MNRQIEEMARIACPCNVGGMCNADNKLCDLDCSEGKEFGKLYDAGYRKASEVFEEIKKLLRQLADETKILRDKEINLGEKTQLNGEWIGVRLALRDISELKKKYIGKDTNVPTNTEEGK